MGSRRKPSLPDVFTATEHYESWLADQLPLVAEDLVQKHAEMARDPFRFLRATYYRWLQRWAQLGEDLLNAPKVFAVADLHVENFGTWRDAEGRLVWGVNDFDEAVSLPWTQDLVRLASSARLAIAQDCFSVAPAAACDAILQGYVEGLNSGGRPFVLAEDNGFLRRVAATNLREPKRFWRKLDEFPPADEVPSSALRELRRALPEPTLECRWVHRVSGLGSLGRQRFVAIANWDGARIAREAKRQAPPSCVWAWREPVPAKSAALHLVAKAIRAPDPFLRIGKDWIVRRLAPDCVRIDSKALATKRDQQRLLHSMGFETANVHLASDNAVAILDDLAKRENDWLNRSSRQLAASVVEDWTQWSRGR
jgi:Uncharacterized protein conserved in bacteria (DUF2252)